MVLFIKGGSEQQLFAERYDIWSNKKNLVQAGVKLFNSAFPPAEELALDTGKKIRCYLVFTLHPPAFAVGSSQEFISSQGVTQKTGKAIIL